MTAASNLYRCMAAALILTTIAGTGSPVIAQQYSDESRPLFVLVPDSPLRLVRSAVIAVDHNRSELAREYLQRVVDEELDVRSLLDLRDRVGLDVLLLMNANTDLQPAAGQLLDAINQAADEQRRTAEEAPQLVRQLGQSEQATAEAGTALLGIGDGAAEALLTADQEEIYGQIAWELLQTFPRQFHKGVLDVLVRLNPEQQVRGIQILGASADRDVLPTLLVQQANSEHQAVREAAIRAVEQLWDRGAPPSDAVAAVTWLTHRARRELAVAADRFAAAEDVRQAARSALQAATAAAEIRPDDPAVQATLIACRAAVSQPVDEFSAGARQQALTLAVEQGSTEAASKLLSEQSTELYRILHLPDARLQVRAALLLLGKGRSIRGESRARKIVGRAAAGSRRPEAVVIDPRQDLAILVESLLEEQGFQAVHARTGREGFDAAVSQLNPELILVHTNCLKWPLSLTIANLRGDARTSRAPIVIHGPARDRRAVERIQQRYEGIWFLQEPLSEINFADELRRLKLPAPELTEAERVQLIEAASAVQG